MDEDATWCGSTLSWPGFRRHIQMSSYGSVVPVYVLSRRCTCSAAPAYALLPRYCRAIFMTPIVCVPVELTYMRATLI